MCTLYADVGFKCRIVKSLDFFQIVWLASEVHNIPGGAVEWVATSPSTYFKVLKKINSPQLFSFSQLIFHFIPLFTKAGISLLPLLCFFTMEYSWAVDIWSNWQFFKQNSTRGWQNVCFRFRKLNINIPTYGQALFFWHIRYQELTIWKQWASFSFSSTGNTVNVKAVGTALR